MNSDPRQEEFMSVIREGEIPGEANGPLNGLTILRFAHALETGGGMERHLTDLDRTLLQRNAMTIIRVFVGTSDNAGTQLTDHIGQGQLIRVALPLPEGESLHSGIEDDFTVLRAKRWVRDYVLYNPLLWNLWTKRFLLRWRIPRRVGEVVGAGSRVAAIMKQQPVDLVVLHFIGGSDTDEIIAVARSHNVPFVVQNHFSNDRFMHLSIRKHTLLAQGVAGINSVDIPQYLRHTFQNLSNGIDTEFFRRDNVDTMSAGLGPPVILLPARMVRTKGHLDLIKAGGILHNRACDFQIALAGRKGTIEFEEELRQEIVHQNLVGKVRILGSLPQEQLRECYAASHAVAFPTYHHEGLGRVVIEAQAMKVPPVAYATGGVPEGLVPGKTGFLLRTGDVHGLANRIEELLRDKDLRQRMGEEGRRFVEARFSLEALAKRHEAFYISTIRSSTMTCRGRPEHL